MPHLVASLRHINESLWTIEDEIRDRERRGDFGAVLAGGNCVLRKPERNSALAQDHKDAFALD